MQQATAVMPDGWAVSNGRTRKAVCSDFFIIYSPSSKRCCTSARLTARMHELPSGLASVSTASATASYPSPITTQLTETLDPAGALRLRTGIREHLARGDTRHWIDLRM